MGLEALDAFNSEVWKGKHAPLVLGWTDGQLDPVKMALAPALAGIEPDMQIAVALCARSLVLDYVLTGNTPVRFSRKKDVYGRDRYRKRERFFTHHYVTKAIDHLYRAGLVEHETGEWAGGTGGTGRQSVAWPTSRLLELLVPVINLAERRGEPDESEVIILRGANKKLVKYDDDAETAQMRAGVQLINDALRQLSLYREGRLFPIPLVRRVFNLNFGRGGRFYCHGPSFQNIPSEERADLQLMINGELRAMVEIDYAALHPTMAYTEANISLPSGDVYANEGFDRDLLKCAVNILLNAKSRHKAVQALTEALHKKSDWLFSLSGLPDRFRTTCRPFAMEAISVVEEKHKPIAAFFGSDCGARFQRKDSDMALRVMMRVMDRAGRCPLPMHDSFLVADIDKSVLREVMQEVAIEEGLTLKLKES